MPDLQFVLPHWLYWGTLMVFPILATYLVARQVRRGAPQKVSLFVAYLFWVTAGFLGLHRFYLKNAWGFIFIPVFLGILYTDVEIRDRREDVSRTRAALEPAHLEAERATPAPNVTATAGMTARAEKAQAAQTSSKQESMQPRRICFCRARYRPPSPC